MYDQMVMFLGSPALVQQLQLGEYMPLVAEYWIYIPVETSSWPWLSNWWPHLYSCSPGLASCPRKICRRWSTRFHLCWFIREVTQFVNKPTSSWSGYFSYRLGLRERSLNLYSVHKDSHSTYLLSTKLTTIGFCCKYNPPATEQLL